VFEGRVGNLDKNIAIC